MAELYKAKPWREHNPIVMELGSRAYTAGSFQSMKCLKTKKPIMGREGENKKEEMGRKGKKHEKEKKEECSFPCFPSQPRRKKEEGPLPPGHSCGWAEGTGLSHPSPRMSSLQLSVNRLILLTPEPLPSVSKDSAEGTKGAGGGVRQATEGAHWIGVLV